MQDLAPAVGAEELEIVEFAELGEVAVNVTGMVEISAVIRALPSTVTTDTVVSREVVADEEGEVSVWLIFRTRDVRAVA